MKRLKYAQVVRLRNQDEFTIVVPPVDKRQSLVAQKFRRLFLQDVKKAMLDGMAFRTAHDRDAKFAEAIQECTFQREAKPHVEFHVRIVSYPERETLQKTDLPNPMLNYFMGEGATDFTSS